MFNWRPEAWRDNVNTRVPEDRLTLTLRDYFAAHAPPYPFRPPMIDPRRDESAEEQAAPVAKWNYAYADAMLREARK